MISTELHRTRRFAVTRAALDLRFLAHGVLKASKHREPTVQPTRPSSPVWGFEPIRCIAYHAVRSGKSSVASRLRCRSGHGGAAADHRRQQPRTAYSERSFAALCGAPPVQASSGKTHRHRLSRGGDRAAVSALHRITLVHMANHRPTRAYVARQTASGRSKREIIRMLKRQSPERSTGSSPIPPRCPTTPTSAPSGKPRTSP